MGRYVELSNCRFLSAHENTPRVTIAVHLRVVSITTSIHTYVFTSKSRGLDKFKSRSESDNLGHSIHSIAVVSNHHTSKSMCDTMDCYADSANLLRLLQLEHTLSPPLRNKINEKARFFLENLKDDVGEFLCSEELDGEHHSEENIRILVQCVPTALTYTDDYGDLPLDHALLRGNVEFIPMLAEEGMKLEVLSGHERRGGLLRRKDPGISCVLESISYVGSSNYCSIRCLNVIKRLRKMGLFKVQDIKKYNLLWHSCSRLCAQRFNYFADWDPSALKQEKATKDLFLLIYTFHSPTKVFEFELALNASLRHFPHELGLLLRTNYTQDDTVFRLWRQLLGKKIFWCVMERCLDGVARSTNIFEKNLETNMYAFMFAAAGPRSELDLVYYLIRRNPLALQPEKD